MASSSAPAPARTPRSTAAVPDLPFRTFYEEFHREAIETLKRELTEGVRMDITKRFKEKFHISHSMMARNTVIPSKLYKIVKTPTIYYDFGAGYTSSKSMLLAKMTKDGRLSAEFKYDFTHNLALKANAHLTDEPHKLHGFINFDYKRSYDRFLFQMESRALLGAAYIVNVNPYISFGEEVLWACQRKRPDFGFVLRYHDAKTTATGHFRNTGMIGLSYVHRVSKEVCLASNLMYNAMSKNVIASFGYDCNTPLSRVRGKMDSNGVVSVIVESQGCIVYSLECDHNNRDYKLGFGLKLSD